MLIVAMAIVTLLVSLWTLSAGMRRLDTEIGALRRRVARLVRLSVAVDDLRHETTQVVPAYRQAAGRAKALRRTEHPEAPR
jgi:hypothetical protein